MLAAVGMFHISPEVVHAQTNVAGTWHLVAMSSYRGQNFEATLSITQVGTQLSGSFTVTTGDPCVVSANFSGSVGSTISIQVNGGFTELISLTGSLVGAAEVSGTYTLRSANADGSCNPLNNVGGGDAGTWTATRTVTSPPPLPSINGVVSASAFGALLGGAPGSWIEIYGANLASDSREWTSADFSGINAPTALDGTSVTIGGQHAYVDYISPGQVNAQVPSGVGTAYQPVVVTTSMGASAPVNLTVALVAPGLLAPPSFNIGGKQYVAAVFSDGETYVLPPGTVPTLSSRRAQPGDVITFYGVGFGAVTPNIPAGQIVEQINAIDSSLQVLFGATQATVTYAGLVANAVGLYQINAVVPNVSSGDLIPVTFTVAGMPGHQSLYIAVQ